MKSLNFIGLFTLVILLPLTLFWAGGHSFSSSSAQTYEQRIVEEELGLNSSNTPRRFYIANNEKNRQLINGLWEVQTHIDKNGLFKKVGLKAHLALVGISTIEVDYKEKKEVMTFLVSYHGPGSLILFRLLGEKEERGKTFEVISAFKIADKDKKRKQDEKKKAVMAPISMKAPKIAQYRSREEDSHSNTPEHLEDTSFVLRSVSNIPKNLGHNVKQSQFSSIIRITGHSVEELTIVYKNEEIFHISGARREGNKFIGEAYEYGESNPIIGLLMKNGRDAYKVRLATGKFSGMELNIVSEQKDREESSNYDDYSYDEYRDNSEKEYEESSGETVKVKAVATERQVQEQNRAALIRQEVNRQLIDGDAHMDNNEVVEELSLMNYEQLKERVQDISFDFSNPPRESSSSN